MPKTEPQVGHLVRVTYRVHRDQQQCQLLGVVAEVRAPGEGPLIRKPGKRIRVIPEEGYPPSLGGWYSTNEVEVVGWDWRVLTVAQRLALRSLTCWARYRAAGVVPVLRALERRDLVSHVVVSGGWVTARLTQAGWRTADVYQGKVQP